MTKSNISNMLYMHEVRNFLF